MGTRGFSVPLYGGAGPSQGAAGSATQEGGRRTPSGALAEVARAIRAADTAETCVGVSVAARKCRENRDSATRADASEGGDVATGVQKGADTATVGDAPTPRSVLMMEVDPDHMKELTACEEDVVHTTYGSYSNGWADDRDAEHGHRHVRDVRRFVWTVGGERHVRAGGRVQRSDGLQVHRVSRRDRRPDLRLAARRTSRSSTRAPASPRRRSSSSSPRAPKGRRPS